MFYSCFSTEPEKNSKVLQNKFFLSEFDKSRTKIGGEKWCVILDTFYLEEDIRIKELIVRKAGDFSIVDITETHLFVKGVSNPLRYIFCPRGYVQSVL